MNSTEYAFVQRICKDQVPQGPVLEVGSRNVNGSTRDCFAGLDYIGVDIEAGLGVDRLMDAHALDFPDHCFATVVSTSMLEHVRDPALCVREMRRVLRPGGLLIINMSGIACPFHAFPVDFWRATEQTFIHIFFEGIADDIAASPTGGLYYGYRDEELIFEVQNLSHGIHAWARMRPEETPTSYPDWETIVNWNMGYDTNGSY